MKCILLLAFLLVAVSASRSYHGRYPSHGYSHHGRVAAHKGYRHGAYGHSSYRGKREAEAEPEPEAEAEPSVGYAVHPYRSYHAAYPAYTTYSHRGYYPLRSYGYRHGYTSGLYRHKREADAEPEAEPEAEAEASVGYGVHPYRSYHHRYPSYGYTHRRSYPYRSYGHGYAAAHYRHRREADAEPEAEADAEPGYAAVYTHPGYVTGYSRPLGFPYSGPAYTYSNLHYGRYPYTTYGRVW